MKEHDIIKYWTETSAKSGENIESLFLNTSKFLYTSMLDDEACPSESELGPGHSQPTSVAGSVCVDSNRGSPVLPPVKKKVVKVEAQP